MAPWERRSAIGQVVVEILLILPVFLTIVFTIMEMGNLSFWVIVLNHATYECARIGAMIATPKDAGEPRNVDSDIQKIMTRIIPEAVVHSHVEPTVFDAQAEVQNHDLVVTGGYNAPLVFPISNIAMASPKGSGKRRIEATVRMPIERPLLQGESQKGMGGKGGKFQK